MPLYTVRRAIHNPTPEELDAAGARAVMCAYEFDGLRWHQSYWDAERGLMTCIYEAIDERQIIDHAKRSRIPCDEVRAVVEIRPDGFVQELAPDGYVRG